MKLPALYFYLFYKKQEMTLTVANRQYPFLLKNITSVLKSLFLIFMRSISLLFMTALVLGCKTRGLTQSSYFDYGQNIQTAKLYRWGDQTSLPVIGLNSSDQLLLDFDDLSNRVRNYYYTFELRNADWSPTMLKPFEYIKGFQNVRITNYRNSSIATTRYIHYQAVVPDRNCYPGRSGNYLLKVYLDNDTSKVVLTKRFVVVSNQTNVAAQVQQPYNAQFFREYQKLIINVQTDNRIQVLSPNDLKVVLLQNNNWQTSMLIDRPTIYRGNYYEYSDESVTAMPAAREFRWIDLRSLRLMSDRMQNIDTHKDTTNVFVKPDAPRKGQATIYYRDLNGSYVVETAESINPFWQSDYAYVHFSYFPPGNREIPGSDVYLFGEMTNYAADTSGKMVFNQERGAYEKTLFLKQGFYNYLYATKPRSGKGMLDFSQTEGNFWGTENAYTILVYYRPFGARADEVIGYTSLNSVFQGQ